MVSEWSDQDPSKALTRTHFSPASQYQTRMHEKYLPQRISIDTDHDTDAGTTLRGNAERSLQISIKRERGRRRKKVLSDNMS